jgi:type II secretory pathway component PulF
MPTFVYKAKLDPTQLQEGVVEAENAEQAVRKINELGLYPVSVNLKSEQKKISLFKRLSQRRKISRSDIVNFTRQLSSLLSSGLNILPSLNVLKNQAVSPIFISLLDDVSNNVKSGASFSESLSRYENVFSPLYINVVRSGELSGRLTSALDTLADFLDRLEDLRQRIISALVYPALVLSVGIVTVAILLIFVIPRISTMYQDMGQVLPLPTQIIVGISYLIVHYFWLICALIIFAIFLTMRTFKTKEGRDFIDKMKLSIPFLKTFVLKQHMVQFSRTLALLLSSGVPIVAALELVSETLPSHLIRQEVETMARAIREGESLSDTVKNAKYFPSFVANIISVAEESGTLDTSLTRIANSFERDVENIIKKFNASLEPVLILLIGIVVGFIVISMLLPIFQINLIVG